jgi:hypothetical protein
MDCFKGRFAAAPAKERGKELDRATSAIRNRRSAVWNILNPTSLSIDFAVCKDISKTIFQIADRRLRIAVQVFPISSQLL